jgi:electron transfer flavoprotein alpha subunit
MSEIMVLAEHRRGDIRDITLEMLGQARDLAAPDNLSVTVVLMGHNVGALAERLARFAPHVLLVENESLEVFNADAYQSVLASLIRDRNPLLTLIGHTAFGLDLAPSLATELRLPLVTDCMSVELSHGTPTVVRPAYGGKTLTRVAFREATGYLLAVQAGAYAPADELPVPGQVETIPLRVDADFGYRKFVEYLEASAGEQDITQYDVVVSVGRGIGDAGNIEIVEKLANAVGGALACSRPVVDQRWLPKFRQVGISGKTVRPKVYIAVGISGAFQHVAGMKGAATIMAINKDPRAPIFNVADYGVVGDLFKVVPALTQAIVNMKSGK